MWPMTASLGVNGISYDKGSYRESLDFAERKVADAVGTRKSPRLAPARSPVTVFGHDRDALAPTDTVQCEDPQEGWRGTGRDGAHD
jgi:hypothetical protein